jgi:hypothetical protein
MHEVMEVLRELKPECRTCINAIRYRAELATYQTVTSVSIDVLKGVYLRNLRCGGLVSLIANSEEWQEDRMRRDELNEVERAKENLLGVEPVEIPAPGNDAEVTRPRELCNILI